MRGYDQWKTASPYDDVDDTRCWHCGQLLPIDADEVRQPWLFDGYCSYECHEDPKDIPCSRAFWNLLRYHFSAKDFDSLSKQIKKYTGHAPQWLEFDTIKIGKYALHWPEADEVILDFFNSVDDQETSSDSK